MNEPTNTAASAVAAMVQPGEKLEVSDMDTFVKLTARWHANKVARLEHYLQLPDGQVVQLGDEPEFSISGDARKGFLLGINMALMEFGILPFSFELEDAPDNQPAQDPMPMAVDDLKPAANDAG